MTENTYGKNKKYIIFMAALVAVSVFGAITGDPVQSMLAAGVGGGFFAAVCIRKRHVLTIIPMVVLPPLLTFVLTGAVERTVLAFSFLPVGIAVYSGIKKGLSRSQTLVRSVGALTVFYCGVYALYVYMLFDSINLASIEKYIGLNLDAIRLYMEAVKNIYAETGMDVEQYFSKELLDSVVQSFRVSWLGYGLAIFGAVSYVATMISKSAVAENDPTVKPEIRNGKWAFVFSKAGAFVFIMAYFAGGLYSPANEGLYFPFALNAICLSMYPAILYMGGRKVIERLRSQRRMFYLLLLIISFSVFGNSMLLFLLIIGLYATFTYKAE